jgi:hypothetical protein
MLFRSEIDLINCVKFFGFSATTNLLLLLANGLFCMAKDRCCFVTIIQVLLLFPKVNDAQCVAFAEAVQLTKLQCDCVTSLESAHEAYKRRQHSLVVIDARNLRTFDALLMCK